MSRIHPPPRLLNGATLLFWGAMTGRPFVGLVLALLVESPQWLRWRWDFGDAEFARAWQMVLMLSGGFVILMLIDGERELLMPMLVSWLPALLLPMQLAQTFGLRGAVPLGAMSFFARRRRERNRRLGIEEPEVMFHFGNAYFVLVLLSAALGDMAEGRLFLPGLMVLCVWRFMALPSRRAAAIAVVFVCAGVMAVAGQAGLNRAYEWFSRGHGGSGWMSDATHGFTSIGSMRDLKLSSEIRWRLRPAPGDPPPRLLRRASFNRYRGVTWEITRLPGTGGGADAQFDPIDTIEEVAGEAYYLANPEIDNTEATSDDLPRFRMRGSTRPGGAMPLPGSVASFRDFDLDAAERNLLSTVRIFPAAPVVDGTVLWRAGADADGGPILREDLRMPPLEAEVVTRVAREIGLEESMTTAEKMGLLQQWFAKEFDYTLYLSMRAPAYSVTEGTAIGLFLEETRSGHCEYFATAAVFLLRAAGVPARYTTGYALAELDERRNEFVIRGTHSHAWCRVWVAEEGRWMDFDPTPPDWFAMEAIDQVSRIQRMWDGLQRAREDLFIWRSDPENRRLLVMIVALPGMIGTFWVGLRLWKSRHTGVAAQAGGIRGDGMPSPLHGLEKVARRHLGPRPDGMPYARWLRPLGERLNGSSGILDEAIRLHQKLRFDPEFKDTEAARKLEGVTRDLKRMLGKRSN